MISIRPLLVHYKGGNGGHLGIVYDGGLEGSSTKEGYDKGMMRGYICGRSI
jgi:hypothetical protein